MRAAIGLLGRTCPGQAADCGDSIAARDNRKTIVFPSVEPADDVTSSVEPKPDEVARGKDRGIAVIANENQPLFGAAEIEVAPRAVKCDPPFEHRSRDVQTLWDHPMKLARVMRANVDDDPVDRGGGESPSSVKPRDPARGLLNQTIKRDTFVSRLGPRGIQPLENFSVR